LLKALKEKDVKLAEETLSKHLLRGEVEALELD
jgi:hypothetical protein